MLVRRSGRTPCSVVTTARSRVGEDTSVQDGAVLHTTPMWPTRLGNQVTVGHNAHLEACTVEDKALIGSGSIVLHNARIGARRSWGPARSSATTRWSRRWRMALGVPATIKEGAVEPGHFDFGIQSYVHRAERYREELRRLPDHP